ncbi:MAG: rRNA pseudouridine synthase [Spirochaetaceae bacterium]|jgi:23S rRNA pseudouridine2605 synthase|nr:rRNA pseudouridine synthase [Spirochaetaceae bacterium]
MNTAQSHDALSVRLHVYLARAGVASRRSAEKFILQGRIMVNGELVTTLGTKVLLDDEVLLDGVPVHIQNRHRYILLNKPPLFLCSAFDPQGRALAQDLLPQTIHERLYTIGRLDYRSCGALIFTNDGNFTARLSHPSTGIEKEYEIRTSGAIPDSFIEEFIAGITLEQVYYQAKTIERLGKKELRIVLIEGKNREIRRVLSAFHLHPLFLQRVRYGPVVLGDLPEGECRPLTPKELALCKFEPV